MALGEYVSVSTQRDTERALLAKERRELAEEPEAEFAGTRRALPGQGTLPETATTVARELTERDAFAAHIDIEWASTRRTPRTPGMRRSPRRSVHCRSATTAAGHPAAAATRPHPDHVRRRPAGAGHHRLDQRTARRRRPGPRNDTGGDRRALAMAITCCHRPPCRRRGGLSSQSVYRRRCRRGRPGCWCCPPLARVR